MYQKSNQNQKRKYDRITPTLIDLHWLPVAHRINFKLATIVYKTKIHHQPEYLDNLLVKYKQPRVLRSSADEFLAVPRTRTVLATRAFSVAAPKRWNTIPIDIRNSLSLVTFKSKLKTFLFRRSYAQVCGLGLDVSVSRRSRDLSKVSSRSRLGHVGKRLGLVSLSGAKVSVLVSVSTV